MPSVEKKPGASPHSVSAGFRERDRGLVCDPDEEHVAVVILNEGFGSSRTCKSVFVQGGDVRRQFFTIVKISYALFVRRSIRETQFDPCIVLPATFRARHLNGILCPTSLPPEVTLNSQF